MEAVQMNTRIEKSLKAQGDDVFAKIGWTPSTAIRALWRFAARHANDPSAVTKALIEEDPTADEAKRKRLEAALIGPTIVAEGLKEIREQPKQGGEIVNTIDGRGDDFDPNVSPEREWEYVALEMLERLQEKGLDK